jgi:hypothetical protein
MTHEKEKDETIKLIAQKISTIEEHQESLFLFLSLSLPLGA